MDAKIAVISSKQPCDVLAEGLSVSSSRLGGGLRMGQVIGRSDRLAGEPASDLVTVEHLLATILHTLFEVGQLRLISGMPTEILRWMERIEPISALF